MKTKLTVWIMYKAVPITRIALLKRSSKYWKENGFKIIYKDKLFFLFGSYTVNNLYIYVINRII